ncbi:MAG TPA: DEAD/DEAH box helicase [Candidatus Elarobacter sp.]
MAAAKRGGTRRPPPTRSEAAFLALVAQFEGGTDAAPPAPSGAADFVASLYARADDYLSRDPYATIGDATGFNTKVVGVTFDGRDDSVGGMQVGFPLELRRDAANPHDPNAVGVWYGQLHLGYLKRPIAARIAPNIDAGERYAAEVTAVTGGGSRATGLNIYVTRERAAPPRPARDRGEVSREDVLRALIGERPLREAQRLVLDRLDSGRNVLAVLGTGRGKSLCFQYPAAVRALESGAKTVVLYPLRALANDQYEALMRRLEPLGLRIFRANGAIDAGERAALNDALENGTWDLICATPEFVQFHLDRFRSTVSQPSLIVVDEAHHLAESTHRAAYQRIGAAIEALGSPQVLALTATAGDAAFAKIRETLRIDAWVIDPTVRENLHVVDARNTPAADKVGYIERFVAAGGKAIVYCNSRNEATKTAEKLRRGLGDVVAFYHAGVASAERAQVETYFREGVLRVVVATSAFGEGIDLPDVRHVFLYHLNFDFTEFNQQSGRAGRDGDDATIHLLFGEKDRNINDYIIDRAAPRLETLRTLYAALKRMASAEGTLRQTYVDMAATLDLDRVDASTISAAVRIFADAGLVETGDDDDGRFVRFLPVSGKVDLTAGERYLEGEAEREAFVRFAGVVLTAQPAVLETLINKPIYPSGVPLVR